MKRSLAHVFILSGIALASAAAAPQPDFTLADVNPGSDRSGQTISPRDYQQQISVYYFGREW